MTNKEQIIKDLCSKCEDLSILQAKQEGKKIKGCPYRQISGDYCEEINYLLDKEYDRISESATIDLDKVNCGEVVREPNEKDEEKTPCVDYNEDVGFLKHRVKCLELDNQRQYDDLRKKTLLIDVLCDKLSALIDEVNYLKQENESFREQIVCLKESKNG